MWWILQITACALVTVGLVLGRYYGFTVSMWLVNSFIAVAFTTWMFVKSYEVAPSFLAAWFVGTAALAIFGFVGSAFIFHEAVEWYKYLAAGLVVVGGVLLVV